MESKAFFHEEGWGEVHFLEVNTARTMVPMECRTFLNALARNMAKLMYNQKSASRQGVFIQPVIFRSVVIFYLENNECGENSQGKVYNPCFVLSDVK